MQGKTVSGAAICTEAWEITGATVEFKKKDVHLKTKPAGLAQLCAYMIRVSGFLAEKALSKGRVVEEINILGLLVSHTSRFCIPLRYHTCVDGETTILRGDEILFDKAIAMVLAHL